MASRERVVEFAVKARDEYSQVLKNLEQQQNRLSAAAKASTRRAVLGVAKQELVDAQANYARLIAEVDRYRGVQAKAAKSGALSAAEMRELGETIKLVRDRSRDAAAAIDQKRAALGQVNRAAAGGFAAFDRMATAMQRGAVAAVQESSAVGGAATQLNKLTAASNNAAAAQANLKSKTDAANASMGRKSGARGNAQDVEVFGLKPWQLTNLGYQVNDVVSGLAMGQAPMQVFAQQAGQIAQIWPNVMVSLARSIPIIAGVTAVLAPFIAAGMRLHNLSESLKIFRQELALSADGARYNAEYLGKAVQQMDDFGIATDKARDIVRQFIRDGIAEKDIVPLAKMAKQLDAITGEGVGEAAKRLSTAFGGTMEDVRELDKELNFLSASQYASIAAMAKAGDSAGAISAAQEALAAKLAASTRESTSWSRAVDSMGKSWNTFVRSLEKSGLIRFVGTEFEKMGRDIERTAQDLERWADAFHRMGGGAPDQLRARLRELDDFVTTQRSLGIDDISVDRAREEAQVLREQLLVRRETLEAARDAVEVQKEAAGLSEADKKARLDIQEVINKQIKALEVETSQAALTNRERHIEGELLKAKNAALEKAKQLNQDVLDLTAEQTKAIRLQAGLAYDAANPNYEAKYTAQRGTPQGAEMAQLVAAISALASKMELSAKDLLTAISFETGGTFNPRIVGGAGNNYEGLFQAGPAARAKYSIGKESDIPSQVIAMGKYLADAGVKAGDGLLQIYAAINAGHASRINASDEKNGGTPGTVLDKVSEQMDQHQAKAEGILAAYGGIAEQAKKTAEYNKDYDERVKTAQLELDLATKTNREASITKALRDEELRAKKAGVELTADQIEQTKQLAAAEFDRAHVNDEVNRLVEQRTALFESLQIAQFAGDQGKVFDVIGQIGGVERQLNTAIEKAILFWQALGGPGSEQAILQLENVQDSIGQTVTRIEQQFLPQAVEINEQLADIGGNAFSAFAQALANGENVAQAFFNTLLQGISDFLIEIGKAIIKQALFNALSGGAGEGGSGGIGGMIGGWLGKIFQFHDGGIIGSGGTSRGYVNPMLFANAQRYHSGGIIDDLKPGEVPIIAMKDEEMLTTDDPRHSFNGGGKAVNLKNVNVFDPTDVMEAALSSVPGERILLNFLTRNSRKVSAAINGSG